MAAGRTNGAAGYVSAPENGYRPGAGTGMARPGPLGAQACAAAGHDLPVHELRWIDSPAAARAIWWALRDSVPLFGPLVYQQTGEQLEQIGRGIVPALLMSIGVVAATSVLGVAVGAAIGALAGGVGAAPGAVIGGELGYDLGVAVLSLLGLGFLIAAIGAGLADLKLVAQRAVRHAINSLYVGSGCGSAEMMLAAEDFAQAEATLVKLILMGLVAWLLRRPVAAAVKTLATSTRAAASGIAAGDSVGVAQANVAGLVALLRASRLGEGFAGWVESNWRELIENPRLRPKVSGPSIAAGASTAVTPSQLARAAGRAGAEPEALDRVVKTPKGSRPAPSQYLSDDYIASHLARFDDGAVKVVAASPTGAVGPPQGTYVLPKTYVQDMIQQSGGSVARLEELLSLDKGSLGSDPMLVEVKNLEGLRMPSGNEPGANLQWLPAGYTGGGVPEAVVDQIQPGNYVVTPIFPK